MWRDGSARWRRRGSRRTVALGFLLAMLLFLTAYPMGMLVYGSLHSTPPGAAGTRSLDGYRAMLSRGNAIVLLNTIGLSLVKTCLAMGLALFLAWIVARTDTPYRETLEGLITLPFYIPPIRVGSPICHASSAVQRGAATVKSISSAAAAIRRS